LACSSQSTNSIPEGAIAIEYASNGKPVIYIPGTLNDSIPLRFYFETGWSVMSFSDNLASDFERKQSAGKLDEVLKPMKVQIGTCEQIYGESNRALYLERDFFKYMGNDVAMLPWTFFDKKIIEISHSRHYFRELPDTPSLSGYDAVRMEVDAGFFKIPVVVSVQGKVLNEYVAIDFGSGGDVEFISNIVSKYRIQQDSATVLGDAFVGLTDGHHSFMRMPADTVKVGSSILAEGQHIHIALSKVRVYPYIKANRFFQMTIYKVLHVA
jgi:hypothetical protein